MADEAEITAEKQAEYDLAQRHVDTALALPKITGLKKGSPALRAAKRILAHYVYTDATTRSKFEMAVHEARECLGVGVKGSKVTKGAFTVGKYAAQGALDQAIAMITQLDESLELVSKS